MFEKKRENFDDMTERNTTSEESSFVSNILRESKNYVKEVV